MLLLILTLLVLYVIFLFNFKGYISTFTIYINVEYNGLLWVMLDRYTIWKYNSLDKPMHWLKIEWQTL